MAAYLDPSLGVVNSSEAYRLNTWKTAMQTRPRAVASPPLPRVTYRLLQSQGLTSLEATRLTAFLHGLPPADHNWSLHEISQMLFLQQLYRSGRFSVKGKAS